MGLTVILGIGARVFVDVGVEVDASILMNG